FVRARGEGSDPNAPFVGNVVPGQLWLQNFHTVVPVRPSEEEPQSLTYTIALDPGQTVIGTVVDPDGKPLSGAAVAGLTALFESGPQPSPKLTTSDFKVVGLEPQRPRTVVFLHEEKKLARAVTVRSDKSGPLTIRLGSLGTLTGRLIDAQGKPRE